MSLITKEHFNLVEVFSFSTFISILFALAIKGIATGVTDFLNRKLEDNLKLDTNYNALIRKYPLCHNMIEYKNSSKSNFAKGRKLSSVQRLNYKRPSVEDEYKFPITLELVCNKHKFNINDSKDQYVLPKRIMDDYDKIMSAHKYSNIYNQLNIRLDSYKVKDNTIQLDTTRTTYYDSLVTNRAMDFKLDSNVSIRDIYGYGPFFNKLEDSELSNHLGFNGFVETKDGKIIFVQRYNKVSIGKGTLGNSISASLKTKYALDKKGEFDDEGLIRGIKYEILDELKIKDDCYEFSLENNIIALYRDMVEGGKPQLLFYVKLNIDYKKVEENFYATLKKDKSNDKIEKYNSDGNKIIYVERDKLGELYLTPDILVIGNKGYKVMPSASASIVLLINYINQNKGGF